MYLAPHVRGQKFLQVPRHYLPEVPALHHGRVKVWNKVHVACRHRMPDVLLAQDQMLLPIDNRLLGLVLVVGRLPGILYNERNFRFTERR